MENWDDTDNILNTEDFIGYRSRKQAHIHKLAIVMSSAESDDRLITLKHLQRAEAAVTHVEANLKYVHEQIGESSTSKHVRRLLSFITAYGAMEEGRLWLNCMPYMSVLEFKYAIQGGLQAGLLARRAKGGEVFIQKGAVNAR